jgi:TrmH family RNA methyltransferase
MLSNNQIKFIKSLRIKKFRQQYKAFVVEGEKSVIELLESDYKIEVIYATKSWFEKYLSAHPVKQAYAQLITEKELLRISELNTPNQVLAIAKIPEQDSVGFDFTKQPVLALDGICDPGNMGTIIRTADWFGIFDIICSPDSVEIYNPKVIQATMGSFTRVRVQYKDLGKFISELPPGIPIIGAVLDGQDLTKLSFEIPGVILIGSESQGISPELQVFVNQPVFIPRLQKNQNFPQTESLNASVANGIICYEICKQLFQKYF